MTIETLDSLLEEELKDIYDAEKQLVRALPKMAKAASNEQLKSAFQEHLEQTKGHVERLEQIFGLLEVKPKGKPCAAMKGLITEGQETMEVDASEAVLDAMLITAARKVEHYEISGYGTLRSIAEKIGNTEVAELLQITLNEEEQTDQKLTEISQSVLGEIGTGEDEDEDLEDEEFDDDEEDLDEEVEDEPVDEATAKRTAPTPAAAKKKR
jgi:ferritin-like metal-binding protein YciE